MSNAVNILPVPEGEFSTQSHSKSFAFWEEIIVNVAIYSCSAPRVDSGLVEPAVLESGSDETHLFGVSSCSFAHRICFQRGEQVRGENVYVFDFNDVHR